MNEIGPPSGYRVEQAMAAWGAARARLLADDSGLDQDEAPSSPSFSAAMPGAMWRDVLA